MSVMPAHVVHIGVDRDWRAVYAFASDPANMPEWASGLASGLRPDGEAWVAEGGPVGEVRIHFTPPNNLGVIDHVVTMPDGTQVHNALRVTPNGDGAEVSFVLLRRPDMDEAAFQSDAAHVARDLHTLKALLEG